ncbi:hypothetical protein AB8616_19555 [Marinomonas sp. RS-M-Aa-14]|uniref:hypothetical protein n=1 Tax=Marinomonas sp. RS-M-Aa-14 TaxID=3241169 RepID=UPI003AAE100C
MLACHGDNIMPMAGRPKKIKNNCTMNGVLRMRLYIHTDNALTGSVAVLAYGRADRTQCHSQDRRQYSEAQQWFLNH